MSNIEKIRADPEGEAILRYIETQRAIEAQYQAQRQAEGPDGHLAWFDDLLFLSSAAADYADAPEPYKSRLARKIMRTLLHRLKGEGARQILKAALPESTSPWRLSIRNRTPKEAPPVAKANWKKQKKERLEDELGFAVAEYYKQHRSEGCKVRDAAKAVGSKFYKSESTAYSAFLQWSSRARKRGIADPRAVIGLPHFGLRQNRVKMTDLPSPTGRRGAPNKVQK